MKTLVKLLTKKKLKLSIAESCTGGMLASSVTSISGASKIFNLGLVTYSNQAKIKILKVNKSQADNLVCKYHYSKKPTTNSFLSFLVYYNNKINGVLQLGYGIRPKSKGYFDYKEVREFDRMWLSDEMPKYSETIVISCLHKYLKLV